MKNPLKIYPVRILKIDKKIASDIDYKGIKFLKGIKSLKKVIKRLERNIFALMYLVMKIV